MQAQTTANQQTAALLVMDVQQEIVERIGNLAILERLAQAMRYLHPRRAWCQRPSGQGHRPLPDPSSES